MDGVTRDQAIECLGVIAQLLQKAATQVWTRADPDVELQSFGLGVYLSQALARGALPLHYSLPDLNREGQSVLALISAAEELSRSLPVHRPDLVPARLCADLCDLVREARDLGC